MTNRDLLNRLEDAIDASSLANVLEVLAAVCAEKADHLASNWQDDASAKVWARAGVRINRLAASVEV